MGRRLVAVWLLAMPLAAGAQESPVPAAPDQSALPSGPSASAVVVRSPLGFFFHVDSGVGYLQTTGSTGASAFSTSGVALGLLVAGGWAPSEEWMLGLELSSWKALSPSSLGEGASVELDALGLNVTRYLVPANVFASVTLCGTRLAITDSFGREFAGSQIGFGFKAAIGKEWSVTPWLGMGLAGEFFMAVNRDHAENPGTLRTIGGGLVFSMTIH